MKLIEILPLITVWLQVRVLGAHYPGALYLRSQLGIGNVNGRGILCPDAQV